MEYLCDWWWSMASSFFSWSLFSPEITTHSTFTSPWLLKCSHFNDIGMVVSQDSNLCHCALCMVHLLLDCCCGCGFLFIFTQKWFHALPFFLLPFTDSVFSLRTWLGVFTNASLFPIPFSWSLISCLASLTTSLRLKNTRSLTFHLHKCGVNFAMHHWKSCGGSCCVLKRWN